MSARRINRLERQTGLDLNGDGYIGGEGIVSRIERATRTDLNGDHFIGRPRDVYYGYPSVYRYGGYQYAQPYTYLYASGYY